MKKLIKNTAITALAFTVAAVGAVYLPSPFNNSGKDTVTVTEYADDGIVMLSNEDTADIILASFAPDKKIPVIKAVKEVTGLGLGEAKDIVESLPKTLKEDISLSEANEIENKLTEAGGVVTKKVYKATTTTTPEPAYTPSYTPGAPIGVWVPDFNTLTNTFSVNGGVGKSFIDINCDSEVVYEVHVTSLSCEALEKLANCNVSEVYDRIQIIENYYGCGYVLEPYAKDSSLEEKFGVIVELSNIETPDIMPLGYADLTSGNGITVTPLAKIPGKNQLIYMIGGYLNGKRNLVFNNKADAEKYRDYLVSEYQLTAEITPFSRLSYEGKTYNWVPSSNFEAEYNNMISAIDAGTAEFGTCWTNCYYQWKNQPMPDTTSVTPSTSAPVEEQTEFTVSLTGFDASKKIAVIKAVREITGLGLGDCKALVESSANSPQVLKSGVDKSEARDIIKQIEEAGGVAKADGNINVSFTDPSQTNLTLLSNESATGDWKVFLTGFDAEKKIPVIKAVREVTGLGLGEAKSLVEGSSETNPKLLKEDISQTEAEDIAKKIIEAGGKVTKYGTTSTQDYSSQGGSAQTGSVQTLTREVVVIKSSNKAIEANLINAVAEALGIDGEQAGNIVRFNQVVISAPGYTEDFTRVINKLEAAGASANDWELKTVEEVITPVQGYQGDGTTTTPVEEPTAYNVTLDSFDAAKKIPVIKAVKEITGLGLGEAKALVEGAPKTLKENVSKYDADAMIKKIEEAGGKASKKGINGDAA